MSNENAMSLDTQTGAHISVTRSPYKPNHFYLQVGFELPVILTAVDCADLAAILEDMSLTK